MVELCTVLFAVFVTAANFDPAVGQTLYTNSWAVQITSVAEANSIAGRHGFYNHGQVAGLNDVYHFELKEKVYDFVPNIQDRDLYVSMNPNPTKTRSLLSEFGVGFAEQQYFERRVTKSYVVPQNPLFNKQWNLKNTEIGYLRHDMRVEQAWLQGLTGCNVSVAVVDDGINIHHPDLWGNFVTTSEYGKCDSDFGGTSAAASMVSGIVALALEANPSLTWRDVQYLIVYTANPNLTVGPQIRNGAGLVVSRQYGFGVMDAEAIVTRARHWINVTPQKKHTVISTSKPGQANATTPYLRMLHYGGSIEYLEHVVVVLSILAAKRGDIQIELTSPSGTNSTLLQHRPKDSQPGDYTDWPFMSVMFWGENPTGDWTLTITSLSNATITDIQFQLYGVSRVPEAVENIPDQCHSDCRRGCAKEGSNFCDSCVNLRNAYTLECITECPAGYTNRSSYCYNASLPFEECSYTLRGKMGNQ